MNSIDHSAFLAHVRNYVAANPEVGAYVNDAVAQGISESRKEALNRAADMETALCVALAKRYNCREEFILSTLKKWQGRSAVNWDGTIEMLESKRGRNEY